MIPSRPLAIALLMLWPLQGFDDVCRTAVQSWRSPAGDGVMRVVSDRSRVLVFAGAALALVSPAGRAVLAETLVALAPVNLAVEGLKYGVARVRPDGDRNRRNSSFPSSHAANAFTVAAVVARRWRPSALVLWVGAASVGLSRMWLDRHWASDVLMALALALAGAWFAGRVRERWRARRVNGGVAPPPTAA